MQQPAYNKAKSTSVIPQRDQTIEAVPPNLSIGTLATYPKRLTYVGVNGKMHSIQHAGQEEGEPILMDEQK